MNIDTSIQIDEQNWGATLVCKKKPNKDKEKRTRIVFEGVVEGNYFTRIAKLKDYPVSENYLFFFSKTKRVAKCRISEEVFIKTKRIEKFEKFQNKFERKSPTFVTSSDKIKQLMSEIHLTKSMEIPYNKFGSKSVFSKKRENVYIYNTNLAALSVFDPDLFSALIDSARNNTPSGMLKCKIEKRIEILNDRLQEIYTYDGLVNQIINSCYYEAEGEHNSFTWCRSKLEKIGVEFDTFYHENIISIPSFHLKLGIDHILKKDITQNETMIFKKIDLDKVVVLSPQRETKTDLRLQVEEQLAIAAYATTIGFFATVVSQSFASSVPDKILFPIALGAHLLIKNSVNKEPDRICKTYYV
jgi:hypothetical protein